MTFAEAAAIMLGGGSSGTILENQDGKLDNFSYYTSESSVQDYTYDGTTSYYGEQITTPANCIVARRYKEWRDENGNNAYQYKYYPFGLIIENLGETNENVTGLYDIKNGKTYSIQLWP